MWHVASPRAIMLHCHLGNSRRRQRRCLRCLSSHAAACSMQHAASSMLELLQRHNYPSTSSAKALRMSNDSLAGKWTTLKPASVRSSQLPAWTLLTPKRYICSSFTYPIAKLLPPLGIPLLLLLLLVPQRQRSEICILPSDERCPFSFFTFSHFPATA